MSARRCFLTMVEIDEKEDDTQTDWAGSVTMVKQSIKKTEDNLLENV